MVMENNMSNVTDFPTPRERAGVTMLEDMDMLLDALVDAAMALKHSENVSEEDRETDLELMTDMMVKYFRIRGELYPEEEEVE
jgi:hypothetical protein